MGHIAYFTKGPTKGLLERLGKTIKILRNNMKQNSLMQIITHFGDNVYNVEDTALKMAYVPVRKVQMGPGVHPASYTMDTRSLLAVKRPGRGVDHPFP